MAVPARASGVRSGPMSLLVLVLVLCLALLATLALATAAAALHRSEVQRSMTQDAYANEVCAQELWAAASTAAREGGRAGLAAVASGAAERWPGCEASFEDGVLEAVFTQESGRTLAVTLALGDDGAVAVEGWRLGTVWEEPAANLWQGP